MPGHRWGRAPGSHAGKPGNAMKNARTNELGGAGAGAPTSERAAAIRLNGSPTDRSSGTATGSGSTAGASPRLGAGGRALAAACFALVHLIVRAAVRVCFGRVATTGRERFPRRGPVLLLANHPAAWTDVVILEVALARRLHFIAHEPLFRPRIRGLLLELFAALPVWRRIEDPESDTHNRETFERCRGLFRAGEVVAVFPEGVSGGDRDLQPLKTGAARMLLQSTFEHDQRPLLIPVAIRYQDRTVFRTPVVVAIGPAIESEVHRSDPGDAAAAARALTEDMARGIVAALAGAAAYAEARTRARRTARPGAVQGMLAAPAALGGALGMALHAAPLWAIERAARRFADHPQQIAVGRMIAGLAVIPLWYALLATTAMALGGGAWLILPAAAPCLGALACRGHDRRLEGRGRDEAP
jgi:1-acyl-sn-glycerol-3-phosphate acyltransferase